jgi:hypothetical protein
MNIEYPKTRAIEARRQDTPPLAQLVELFSSIDKFVALFIFLTTLMY